MNKFKVGDKVLVMEYIGEPFSGLIADDIYKWMRGRVATIVRNFGNLYECECAGQPVYAHELQLVESTKFLIEIVAAKDARIAELEAQLAELTTPKPVETFEPELLTGYFSSFYGQTVYPFGIVNVAHFYYDGGYEQVIVLPAAWEENKEALETSVGKEITIKATWQDDELEFIFDSIVAEDK